MNTPMISKREHSVRIEAIPMYDSRDHSIKRIRIIQSVNGKQTRGYIASDTEVAKEMVRSFYHLKRRYAVKVIWPFS